MKKLSSLFISAVILCGIAQGQEPEKKDATDGFGFVTVKENKITPVKDQASSGTCWSFSGIGLIESELLRRGKGEYDFSEMFVVHTNYLDKAQKYVRLHGSLNFSAGGSFADVLESIRIYGIVPESEKPGLNYGEERHRHGEMDAVLKSYADAVIKNPNRTNLTTAWFEGYSAVLDAYLGKCPVSFTYGGKEYTPQSFAQSLGIRADDYISLTSYTHQAFYEPFAIEVPDNWRWALSYNLPLDELMEVINSAVEKGFCVAWASDVSEKGFSRNGIAVMPDINAPEAPGSDQARWLNLSEREREAVISNLTEPMAEVKVTQELRQKEYDNYKTTDDHGMLIYGTAQDQNGSKYYLVKNSWGTDNPYRGTWYASVPFVTYKTTCITVHKDVLSKELKNKLNIK